MLFQGLTLMFIMALRCNSEENSPLHSPGLNEGTRTFLGDTLTQEPKILQRSQRSSSASSRMRRFLGIRLLPIVKFRVSSGPCMGSLGQATGTCMTDLECRRKSGKADGTCASGFGVCCIHEAQCDSTIHYNNTYLVNDGYPMKASSILNCVYNIQKMNKDICQLRLDFETLVLAGPNDQSLCRQDKLSITTPIGGPALILCGTNSGQHVYLDMGSGTGSARISIGLTDPNMDRGWRIRISQISCQSPYRAPEYCLQYFTDYSGTLESFNFKNIDGVHQLGGLQYSICVRAKDGICGIKYTTNTFSMSGDSFSGVPGIAEDGDTSCIRDFVLIPSLSRPPSNAVLPDRYCGTAFEDFTSYSKPFQLRVVTDEDEVGDTSNRGFSINYTQIPC